MNAIDTNVFVYALDAAEPAKQAKAREFFRRVLTSNESILVPWQVAVELLARLRKWESAGRIIGDDVHARLDSTNFLVCGPWPYQRRKYSTAPFDSGTAIYCLTGTVC